MLKNESARPGLAPEARATFEQAGTHSNLEYNTNQRCVGRLIRDPDDGRIWLEKRDLDPEQHRLHTPRGWATDVAHLEHLKARGGYGVRLFLNTGERLEASLQQFEQRGVPINRGHGPQVVLLEYEWSRV
jgi:hypothetical protein